MKGGNTEKRRRINLETTDTWAGVYSADWQWIPEMVDLESGAGVGEDYKAIARTRKQERQWKPDPRWADDWYSRPWPTTL
jgi:hypothetical protein